MAEEGPRLRLQHCQPKLQDWARWLPRWRSSEEPACQREQMQLPSLGQKIPWRRTRQHTAVFVPGEPHGQRRLGGLEKARSLR